MGGNVDITVDIITEKLCIPQKSMTKYVTLTKWTISKLFRKSGDENTTNTEVNG